MVSAPDMMDLVRLRTKLEGLEAERFCGSQDGGEAGGLCRRQVAGIDAEMVLRGGLHAEDAFAEFRDVQIDFQYPAFGPEGFDDGGQRGLHRLPEP